MLSHICARGSIVGTQSNAQRETQLLAEWLTQLPAMFVAKTHVRVGEHRLYYGDEGPVANITAALQVWSDWADARVYTGSEIWLVEAALVGTGAKYGQVLDYCDEYPSSLDYKQFAPVPVIPVVLTAAEKLRTRNYFARFGVRTIVFTPSWALKSIATKIVGDLTGL